VRVHSDLLVTNPKCVHTVPRTGTRILHAVASLRRRSRELVLRTRSFSPYTLCWRDVTRSVVGKSDLQIWLYEFGCCAGRSAQGGIRLAKLRRLTPNENLPKACIRQMFGVRTLDSIHRVHTLDGRQAMDAQLHSPPSAHSQLE
jgi:hypothetical protein